MPGPAQPMLLYVVKQVELAIRARLDDIVRPAGLTAWQYTALTVLERQDNMSSAQLARYSFVTAQSMADMIAALEARGLIERHRDAGDRRRLLVALTAQGRALLDRYRDEVRALEEGMLAGLADDDITALRATLRTCHANLSAPLPAAPLPAAPVPGVWGKSDALSARRHFPFVVTVRAFGPAPLSGKDATSGGCSLVSVNAIVIDPEVPEGPKSWLAEADGRRRAPRQRGPVGTYTFRRHRTTVYRREDDREYGLQVPELIPFADPAPELDPPTVLEEAARSLFPRLREHYQIGNAAILYHRRYVCPPQDFDAHARQDWQRTLTAAGQIFSSDVVREQLIDSVRVTTALPYYLWDIAERLAQLSALRADHKAILDGVRDDDPDVAVVLQPQRRAHQLATDDIDRRVRHLEVFASRVAEADAARRREEAVRRLADLNDVHRDLLARVGSADGTGGELPEEHDVQAVIDQAIQAIRAANDAGRALYIPQGYNLPPHPSMGLRDGLDPQAAGEV